MVLMLALGAATWKFYAVEDAETSVVVWRWTSDGEGISYEVSGPKSHRLTARLDRAGRTTSAVETDGRDTVVMSRNADTLLVKVGRASLALPLADFDAEWHSFLLNFKRFDRCDTLCYVRFLVPRLGVVGAEVQSGGVGRITVPAGTFDCRGIRIFPMGVAGTLLSVVKVWYDDGGTPVMVEEGARLYTLFEVEK